MILLGTVDDVFTISGRGTVISFDFAESLDPNLKFRVGDRIELRISGQPGLQSEIRGIEHLRPIVRRKPVNLGLLLPLDVNPQKLAKGMEIWLLRET